jgi:putative hydrolase of the HAD superfamily
MTPLKAVIFDIGGVLTTSPVQAIKDYAEARGADYSVLGPLIAAPEGAWSQWERSDIDTDQFRERFDGEVEAAGLDVSAEGVMGAAFDDQGVREDMMGVVRFLRGRFQLACITNNVVRSGGDTRPRAIDLEELFDVVIESSQVGLRKPDPRIYEMTCERLGVTPAESAFLDDLGTNLKSARALGMTTIKVDQSVSAIEELEQALGVDLPR